MSVPIYCITCGRYLGQVSGNEGPLMTVCPDGRDADQCEGVVRMRPFQKRARQRMREMISQMKHDIAAKRWRRARKEAA